MPRAPKLRFPISPLLLAVAVLALSASAKAEAEEPDLTDVSDPLEGEYDLFLMYDLYYPKMYRKSGVEAFAQMDQWKTNDDYATERMAGGTFRAPCDPYASIGQNLESFPARLYDLPHDVIVNLAPKTNVGSNCGGDLRMTIGEPLEYPAPVLGALDLGSHHYGSGGTLTRSVAADFNGNGYDEVFTVATSYSARPPTYFLTGAVDVLEPSAGLETIRTTGSQNEAAGWGRAVAGDFDGDGNMDVAYTTSNRIVIVTVCGRVFEGVCAGKSLGDVVKRPMIDNGMRRDDTKMQSVALVAGNFVDVGAGDDLFVTFVDHALNSVFIYAFDEDMNATQLHRSDSTSSQNAIVMADGGPIDFWNRQDSVVFAVDHYVSKELLLWHVTFDGPSDKPMRFHRYQTNKGGWRLRGLATGRYSELPGASATVEDFDGFVVAAIFQTNSSGGALEFFRIGSDMKPYRLWGSEKGAGSFAGPPSGFTLLDEPFKFVGTPRNFLYTGDFQGRSVKLGAPEVLRVPQHMQPWVTIGKPPMHVDIIQPWGFSERVLFNFSAVPSDFFTQFSMAEEGQSQSSHTAKTSDTHAGYGTFFGKKMIGTPFSSTNVEFEAGGGYAYEKNVEDVYNTYQSQRFDLSQQTGAADLVGVSGQRKTFYVYPVIGETTCPEGMTECSPSEEIPLLWVIGMPDQTFSELKGAELLEWYQPVHEPYNLLSYPWHPDQLKYDSPAMQLLTNTNVPGFATDSTLGTYELRWSAGAEEGSTTGTNETASWHTKASVTVGSPKWAEAVGSSFSAGFEAEYNGSHAWGSVDTSSSSLGSSQGIKIEKPGSLPDPAQYAYGMKPYIFSEGLPEWSTRSGDDLEDILDEVDQAAWGPLTVAYTVDVDPTNSVGSFWATSPYRQYIDIALNNPVRYELKTGKIRGGTGEEVPKNCVPAQLNQDKLNCMLFRVPSEDDEYLWNDAFYRMRGFFVRPYSELGLDGPNRTTADEGQQMVLEARVYNYSMLPMDDDTKVKVRFYVQEMDGWSYRPVGDSVLLGEDELDPLPGHSNPLNYANWAMASVPWDTTGLGGGYYSFWVVAWAEDADGNILEELQDHGLDRELWPDFVGPNATQQLNSIVDVPLEWVTLLGVGDVPDPNGNVEPKEIDTSFTNNTGFYKQLFYVVPEDISLPAGARVAMFNTDDGSDADENSLCTDGELDVDDVHFSSSTIHLGDEVEVMATIISFDENTEGLFVSVVDGNPEDGGEPLAMELIPYIQEGQAAGVRTKFRPSECGIHEVFVTAGLGKQTEVQASGLLEVLCP